ncbi:hypothetical protein P4T54_24945 [Bacillus mycoides]|uniref:hypothetical protein n=1 Tax=Bacillus mycoides TaxID=1405 RepID=UPI002E20F0BA|nr:hypothetical protein [Bacillus mycoides]MED1047666.1 hypothetical protein [Bacillus mycoides]MED1054403.1 hypothetical protein [Bacillus mycoides]
MYKKIVEYNSDSKQLLGDWNEWKVIKEIDSTKDDLFDYNLLIDGKTYRVCAGSPKQGILAVEEIQLNSDPESDVRCDDGLECPYCGGVDYDGHELREDKGITDCGSDIKYVRSVVMNTLGECEEVIYHTAPVKLKEPIKL